MNILRNYIRNLILEAMKSPMEISGEFAILSTWSDDYDDLPLGTELDFVMYNVSEAQRIAQREIDNILSDIDPDDYDPDEYETHSTELLADSTPDIVSEAIGGSIQAVMRTRTPGAYGACNQAWEVIRSAAVAGYGPTLYDVVMSISPFGLTSDRSSVSSSANKVWKFYADNRTSVDKSYLDDAEVGVTPDEVDDCQLHGRRPYDMIRNAKSKMFFDWLQTEYEEVQNLLAYGMKEKGETDWGNEFTVDELMDYVDNFYNYYEEELEDIDSLLLDFDLDDFNDSWLELQYNESPNLYDDYPPANLEDQDALNLSYNTSYAEKDYYNMQDNHMGFIQWCIEKNLDEYLIDESGDLAQLAVRDFFQSHQ